jgi:hypothetical protein
VLDTLELSTAQEIEAAIAQVFAPRFSDLLETD